MNVKFTKEVEVDISVEDIGHKIAIANSELQGAFFNSLTKGFEGFGKNDKNGMQMLWIKDELTPQAKCFIIKFAEYLKEKAK